MLKSTFNSGTNRQTFFCDDEETAKDIAAALSGCGYNKEIEVILRDGKWVVTLLVDEAADEPLEELPRYDEEPPYKQLHHDPKTGIAVDPDEDEIQAEENDA